MNDLAIEEPRIAELLQNVLNATGLEVDFTIQHHPGAVPGLTIEFTGPDSDCLTLRNAELLNALEHIAAKVIRLEPDQHDLLSFDARGYKRTRHHALQAAARRAAAQVRATGIPFNFAPMSSYERRQLHLMLNAMGLSTASTGEGPERRLILYPLSTFNANEATS